MKEMPLQISYFYRRKQGDGPIDELLNFFKKLLTNLTANIIVFLNILNCVNNE